jgi:hypothetical protein
VARLSISSLDHGERNRLLKAMRAAGIKPPRIGYCVTAFGGEVCRYPKYKHSTRDTGYQVIQVDAAAAKLGAAARRR